MNKDKIIKFYEFIYSENEIVQETIYDYLGDGHFCGGICECNNPDNCPIRDYVDELKEG